jgi:hypothetical protein
MELEYSSIILLVKELLKEKLLSEEIIILVKICYIKTVISY